LPAAPKAVVDAVLHPLLHRNVSDIHQQCYRSTFSASEVCVSDHHMMGGSAGRKLIPAVVYLEMARAAAENATSSAAHAGKTVELSNIVWADPAVLTGSKQMFVALFAQRDDQLAYEIYSQADDGADETIYCQGQALLGSEPAPARIDLAHLKSQMRHGRRDAATHYGVVSQTGVQYGPSYQGVTGVYLGEKQSLAELAIPSAVSDLNEGLVLHPVIVDSALQAAVDFLSPENQPSLPLALESLRIFRACAGEMVAWVRYSPGGAGQPNLQLDIDLCDQHGNVCVQLRGLTYEREAGRIADSHPVAAAAPAKQERTPTVALADAGLVLSEPRAQTFTSGGLAKPAQISLEG